MKSLSTNRTIKSRRSCAGKVRLAPANVRIHRRITPGGVEIPTSRHMPGVWEVGSWSLKPKGAFWTDAELLALGTNTDVKYELWHGKIIATSPARPKHGAVIARLSYCPAAHIYENKLGEMLDGQTAWFSGLVGENLRKYLT